MRPLVRKCEVTGKPLISHDGRVWEGQASGPDTFGLSAFVTAIGDAVSDHFGQTDPDAAPDAAPDPELPPRPDGRVWVPVK